MITAVDLRRTPRRRSGASRAHTRCACGAVYRGDAVAQGALTEALPPFQPQPPPRCWATSNNWTEGLPRVQPAVSLSSVARVTHLRSPSQPSVRLAAPIERTRCTLAVFPPREVNLSKFKYRRCRRAKAEGVPRVRYPIAPRSRHCAASRARYSSRDGRPFCRGAQQGGPLRWLKRHGA